MSKGLRALERVRWNLNNRGSVTSLDLDTIEKELKDRDNALKTISDIIRDFNSGEFASGECALEEITSVLSEVLQ